MIIYKDACSQMYACDALLQHLNDALYGRVKSIQMHFNLTAIRKWTCRCVSTRKFMVLFFSRN